MIDASTFATHHNSFWSDLAPTAEHFVRKINLEHAERWELPLDKPSSKFRAAYVAELAFSRFCAAVQNVPEGDVNAVVLDETRRRLLPLMDAPSTLDDPLSKDELTQFKALQQRLSGYFRHRGVETAVRPVFRGCGHVDASEGDVISGGTLFEIKTVERPFRSVDVRQLLTYCALNRASGQYDLERIGIYNPRRGLEFEMDIDRACREMAGISGRELFESVIYAISSGEISR